VPAAQEVGPQVVMTAPRQTVPSAPRAPDAGMVLKPAAGQTMAAPAGGRGPRGLPAGTIGLGPEWVSISGYLCPDSFFMCPDPAFPFPPSKRRHGSTGLAPRKVLKTAPTTAASATPGHAGRLASSQDAPKQGAQAVRVAVGRAPEDDPSVEAAVVPRETAGAAAASSPPDVLPALAPASNEAVVVLAVEPPVATDAEMAEASLLKAGDRKPAPLAEEVPDAPTAGRADGLEEGGAEPWHVLGSGALVLARRGPNERHGQALWFWTHGASKPLFVLDDEQEEQSRDELRECAEATMGSLRSTVEILSRDVPRILQVRISGVPFT
jgi:hypothetical protein